MDRMPLADDPDQIVVSRREYTILAKNLAAQLTTVHKRMDQAEEMAEKNAKETQKLAMELGETKAEVTEAKQEIKAVVNNQDVILEKVAQQANIASEHQAETVKLIESVSKKQSNAMQKLIADERKKNQEDIKRIASEFKKSAAEERKQSDARLSEERKQSDAKLNEIKAESSQLSQMVAILLKNQGLKVPEPQPAPQPAPAEEEEEEEEKEEVDTDDEPVGAKRKGGKAPAKKGAPKKGK